MDISIPVAWMLQRDGRLPFVSFEMSCSDAHFPIHAQAACNSCGHVYIASSRIELKRCFCCHQRSHHSQPDTNYLALHPGAHPASVPHYDLLVLRADNVPYYSQHTDLISPLILTLSSILVCHFILDLRQVHLYTPSGPSSLRIQLPSSNATTFNAAGTLVFATPTSFSSGIVGNLGAPLRSENEDEDEGREIVVGSSNPLAVAVEELAITQAERKATLKMGQDWNRRI